MSDDGIGLPDDYAERGHGFANMGAGAGRLGGRLIVERRGSRRLAYESCFPVCGPGSLSRRGVPGNNLGTYDACPDPREYRPRRQVNALEPHGGPACHAMQIESDAPEECPLCADGIELVQT